MESQPTYCLTAVIPAKAHYCPARFLRESINRLMAVIPANAGRSAKRGEHPKDGPEGVSEANHPWCSDAKGKMD
jgi:hypothetical protein